MVKGVILAESLRPDVEFRLDGFVVTVVRREVSAGAVAGQPTTWTFLEIEGPDESADELAAALAAALAAEGGWYAEFGVGPDHVVVFAGRVFRYRVGDAAGRAEAARYARSVGVPEHQLDWPEGDGPAPEGDRADDQAAEIQAFWEVVRGRAHLGDLDVVTGASVASALPPPAWAFGDGPRLADELLGLVLAGSKTATATSLAELAAAGEPVPRPGDLSIILDGEGRPRALIRTAEVDEVPFRDVTEEFAALEGEDDRTLVSWRREHERYFRRVLEGTGTEFTEDLPLVLERFELLHPKPHDRPLLDR